MSANKKSFQRIKSFLAYLEAKSALTIREVTRTKPLTFEYGTDIGILVPGPSYVIDENRGGLSIVYGVQEMSGQDT